MFREPQNCIGEFGATSKEEDGKVQLHCAELGVLLPASSLTGKMKMGIGIIIIIIQYISSVLHEFIT